MLDAEPARLTRAGTITISPDGSVMVAGFAGDRVSCRELAVLAQVWGIAALTESLQGDLQMAGGGKSCVE